MFRYFWYGVYRLGHLVRRVFFRRFTRAGRLVLVCLALASLYGLDTRLTMSYQIWSLLTALLLVSITWRFLSRSKFETRRRLPRFATVGDRFHYRVTVRNLTPRRQPGLVLFEEFEDPRPTRSEFVNSDRIRITSFDPFGWRRWRRWIRSRRKAETLDASVGDLPPNGSTEVRAELEPSARGRLHVTGVTLAVTDPFGLFRRLIKTPGPQTITILPKRYPLPPVHLPGIRKRHAGGVALASSVGDAEEFVSLRDYRPGDPKRRIHWRSWAKTGRPIVKEHQEEYFVHHALLLDTFQDQADAIFEQAVSIAASFAFSVRTQESLLDLMFVGPEAYSFTTGRGVAHTDRMLEILASVAPCRDQPVASLVPLVVKRAAMLSACICVLLAWDEQRQNLVRTLRALGLPAKVLVITDDNAEVLDQGPMKDVPDLFHQIHVGRVEEDLAGI